MLTTTTTNQKRGFENNENLNKRKQISVPISLDTRLLNSAGDMIHIGNLKEAVEKTAEFENSDILVKEVNLSVLLVLSKDSYLLTSLLDETVHIMDFYIRIFNTITNVVFSHKKGLQKTLPIASFGREKATLCR